MTDWPVWWLCQMAAVIARIRWSPRTVTPAGVRPRWRSRSSCPLKVSLIDSMTCRSGLNSRDPARSASPLRAGRSRWRPSSVSCVSNSRPK